MSHFFTPRNCLLGIAVALVLAGCASDKPEMPMEPIGLQLVKKEPALKGERFSNLLAGEEDSDLVFLSTNAALPRRDEKRAHTGRSSIQIPAGVGRVTIKLSSLLAGQNFPADWTLVGMYLYATRPTTASLSYWENEQILAAGSATLSANRWTPLFVDLTSLTQSAHSTTTIASQNLVLVLDLDGPGEVWIDDLMLVDNTKQLVSEKDAGETFNPWSIQRKGHQIYGDAPGRFRFSFATPQRNDQGWTVREANAMRLWLTSTGTKKNEVIYSDGRAYVDGQYSAIGMPAKADSTFAEEHASPAELDVPPELGRVVRQSEGDANNDGYNELMGAYELLATGPRFEVHITPRSSKLSRPVFEIRGLPPGKVLANLEGRMVDRMVRLDDGTLLMELPARIERPTTLSLRVGE
jgi:hypothetical protein